MANAAVQWSVDELYSGLSKLKALLDYANSNLLADKAELTHAYTAARAEAEPLRSQDMAMLDPLVHRNSDLRITYLGPARAKFQDAVSRASTYLRGAGYSVPTLSGLGVAPVVVAAAIVAVVVAAIAAATIVANLTDAQRVRTRAAAAIIGDHTLTPAQRTALLQAQAKQIDLENKAHPPLGFDFGTLVPVLGLVAVIMLGPELLRMFGSRRAAA